MARLTRRLVDGRWQITVAGHLAAGDLLRLERACAPALEHCPLPLDLHVENLAAVDAAARLFVRHLVDRGAVLIGDRLEPQRRTAVDPEIPGEEH